MLTASDTAKEIRMRIADLNDLVLQAHRDHEIAVTYDTKIGNNGVTVLIPTVRQEI